MPKGDNVCKRLNSRGLISKVRSLVKASSAVGTLAQHAHPQAPPREILTQEIWEGQGFTLMTSIEAQYLKNLMKSIQDCKDLKVSSASFLHR